MTEAPQGARILLVESDEERSRQLTLVLGEKGGNEVVRTPTVVGCMREIQGSQFDLLITNTTIQRKRDSLKLIEVLLEQKKVPGVPPVVVQSSDQDPALIKRFISAGVIDYVLLGDDLDELGPRVSKHLVTFSVGERVIGEATLFLGPAARLLVERGAIALNVATPADMRREHLPDLFVWIQTKVAPILKDKGPDLMARLEQAFGTDKTN